MSEERAQRRVSRRDIINATVRTVGAVGLGAAGLYAFAPDSSRVGVNQKAPGVGVALSPQPEQEFATSVVIPDAQKVIKITHAAENMRPNIGLRELYLGSFEEAPAMAVVALWDKNTNKDVAQHSRPPMGFQEIPNGLLVPDFAKFVRSSVESAEQFAKVMEKTYELLDQIYEHEGDALDTNPVLMGVVARPASGLRHALVFSQGATTYNNSVSPNSYLNMSFTFERQRKRATI